ncbi:lectin subunit alpha-like [Cochliomyia hominivorax]
MKSLLKILLINIVLLKSMLSVPQLRRTPDGREYLIFTEQIFTWMEAREECIRRNLQLLTIDSESKNNMIIDMMKTLSIDRSYFWLGGHDGFVPKTDRTFYWSGTDKKFTFTYWKINQPDNQQNDQSCVLMEVVLNLFRWIDIWCNDKNGFICEMNYQLELTENLVEKINDLNVKVNYLVGNMNRQLIEKINSPPPLDADDKKC